MEEEGTEKVSEDFNYVAIPSLQRLATQVKMENAFATQRALRTYMRAKEVGAGQQQRDETALMLESVLASDMTELQNEVMERSNALLLQANVCKEAYRNYEAQAKKLDRRKLDIQRAKMEATFS